MASLTCLPPELIVGVAHWLHIEELTGDLSAFAATGRYYHDLVTPILFSRYGDRAVKWVARFGGINILEKAACYARNLGCLVNPEHFELDDPRWPGGTGEPLHLAALCGQDEVVNWLLDHGASTTALSEGTCDCDMYFGVASSAGLESQRWYPLHMALRGKHVSTASLLLSRGAPLHINFSETRTIITALQAAAGNGLVEIVRQIKQYYLEPKHKALASTSHERSEIELPGSGDSASNSELDDPPAAFINTDGRSAMHFLSFCPDYGAAVEIAKDLLELGHSIDEADYNHRTPLQIACYIGNFTAAKALLSVGANPDGWAGRSILTTSLQARYDSDRTAEARKFHSEEEWRQSRIDFLKAFLKTSGNMDGYGTDTTALEVAVRLGLVKETQLLIGMGGACVNAMAGDSARRTPPLESAAFACQPATAAVLLAAGARVNHQNNRGETALYWACENGSTSGAKECVVLFLKEGAKVEFRQQNSQFMQPDILLRQVKFALAGNDNVLATLLENATSANIGEPCWQSTSIKTFMMDDFNLCVCEMLGHFGAKVNYTFQDSDIPGLLARLTSLNNKAALERLWALGDDKIIRTKTGIVPNEFLLVVALLFCPATEESELVAALLEEVGQVRGRIHRMQGKPTLLHIAASGRHGGGAHVKTLLARGCDVDALNIFSRTPLAIAVLCDNLDAIEALLDAGADPFFQADDGDFESADWTPGGGLADEILKIPAGTQLARIVPEYLTANTTCCRISPIRSPFSIAVSRGCRRIIQKLLLRHPSLPPTLPGLDCLPVCQAYEDLDVNIMHQLLRAGLRPKDDEAAAAMLVGLFLRLNHVKPTPFKHWILAAAQHLLEIGANPQMKTGDQDSAVEVLDRFLGAADPVLFGNVSRWFSIVADSHGRKTIKSHQRILDSWLLPK